MQDVVDERAHYAADLATLHRLASADEEEVVDGGDEVEGDHPAVEVVGEAALFLLGVEVGGEGALEPVKALAAVGQRRLDAGEHGGPRAHERGDGQGAGAEQVGGGVCEVVGDGALAGAIQE